MNKLYSEITDEIWMPVNGFESIYEVSSLGRVKSLKRQVKASFFKNGIIEERILKQANSTPYPMVGLSKQGITSRFCVHALVAKAFIPNPENKKTVNHIDGNKLNNRVDNLEWSTYQENIVHAFKTGLSKIPKGGENHMAKMVINTETSEIYGTLWEAALLNKISKSTIYRAIKNENSKYKLYEK